MKDDIVEGYNWTNFPFREDPNTHQRICKDRLMKHCLMHEDDEGEPLPPMQSAVLWLVLIAGTALEAYVLWPVVKWVWRAM